MRIPDNSPQSQLETGDKINLQIGDKVRLRTDKLARLRELRGLADTEFVGDGVVTQVEDDPDTGPRAWIFWKQSNFTTWFPLSENFFEKSNE